MTKAKKTSSMSPEERAQRRSAVGKTASEKIAKSEQLNFRLDEQSILDLNQLAFEKKTPVGTMVREWVLQRLSQEKLGAPELTGVAIQTLNEIHAKLDGLFGKPPAPPDEKRVSERTPVVDYLPMDPAVNLQAWEYLLSKELDFVRDQISKVERKKRQ